jgi:hypothetical protein
VIPRAATWSYAVTISDAKKKQKQRETRSGAGPQTDGSEGPEGKIVDRKAAVDRAGRAHAIYDRTLPDADRTAVVERQLARRYLDRLGRSRTEVLSLLSVQERLEAALGHAGEDYADLLPVAPWLARTYMLRGTFDGLLIVESATLAARDAAMGRVLVAVVEALGDKAFTSSDLIKLAAESVTIDLSALVPELSANHVGRLLSEYADATIGQQKLTCLGLYDHLGKSMRSRLTHWQVVSFTTTNVTSSNGATSHAQGGTS